MEDPYKSWDSKITLLVTPHDDNRYPYLFRFLEYYKSFEFPFKIFILNSCPSDINKELFTIFLKNQNVCHYDYPHEISLFLKLIDGLSHVNTEYCVICSEDDFITPNGLKQSLFFLENHSDYTSVIGNTILFKKETSNLTEINPKINWSIIDAATNSIEYEDPLTRFVQYFSNFNFPVYSALYRTSFLKTIWETTFQNAEDYRFGELLPALLTAINGKIKRLDTLYIAREYFTTSSGQTFDSFTNFIEDGLFNKKYERFRRCLIESLINKSGIDEKKAIYIIDSSMKSYLRHSLNFLKYKYKIKKYLNSLNILNLIIKIKQKTITKSKLTSSINEGFNNPYLQANNSDYIEWERINQIILKN